MDQAEAGAEYDVGGQAKINQIEHIEKLAAELQLQSVTEQRRFFDQGDVKIVKCRTAKSIPAQRAESALIGAAASGHVNGDGEERRIFRAEAKIVFSHGAAGRKD